MDKSTTSGSSESRDISLGCGSDLGTPPSSSQPPPTQSSSTPSSSAQLQPPITLNISTTTGGNFTVVVDAHNSMENLKKIIAKKLKVAKDRICLLHRERELQDGTLKENGLMDGSKIILIPNVETGLLAQRPENTVMQALESLNDSQVNDFLSGKTPLNLSMRLGDHMMLIQLQLSTVNPSSPSHNGSRSRSSQRSRQCATTTTTSQSSTSSTSATTTTPLSAVTTAHSTSRKIHLDAHNRHHHSTLGIDSSSRLSTRTVSPNLSNTSSLSSTSLSSTSSVSSPPSPTASTSSELSSFLTKQDYENLQNIVKNISMAQQQVQVSTCSNSSTTSITTDDAKNVGNCCSSNLNSSSYNSHDTQVDQTTIKSLSSLISTPVKTTSIRNIPTVNNFTTSDASGSSNSEMSSTGSTALIVPSPTTTPQPAPSTSCPDPISAKLTSCLCKRLDSNNSNCETNQCSSRHDDAVPDLIMDDKMHQHQHQPQQQQTHHQTLQPAAAPPMTSTPRMCRYNNIRTFLHKTLNNPIGKTKHRHHHPACSVFRKGLNAEKRRVLPSNEAETASSNLRRTASSVSPSLLSTTATSLPSSPSPLTPASSSSSPLSTAAPTSNNITEATCDLGESVSTISATDSRALAEASRNLTQTLRKLSKEVFTSKVDLSEEAPRKNGGAVIESMKNHGKGIYSGTFSGTLNPALQDRYGRPKRDISTVIHILNDLLSAAPPYSRNARISFESSSSSAATRNSKQTSSKCTSSTVSEPCSKCVTSMRTNTCSYGGCNSQFNIASTRSSGTCPRHGENHSLSSCSCSSDTLNSSALNNTTYMDTSNSFDVSTLDRSSCTCSFRTLSPHKQLENNVDLSNSGGMATLSPPEKPICSKCSIEIENNKTKCKLDQLRLVMQQRKQRREARKLKGAPYGARVVSTTSAAAATGAATATAAATTASTIAPLASPSEVSPNHIVEEVDTAA